LSQDVGLKTLRDQRSPGSSRFSLLLVAGLAKYAACWLVS